MIHVHFVNSHIFLNSNFLFEKQDGSDDGIEYPGSKNQNKNKKNNNKNKKNNDNTLEDEPVRTSKIFEDNKNKKSTSNKSSNKKNSKNNDKPQRDQTFDTDDDGIGWDSAKGGDGFNCFGCCNKEKQ